LAIPRTDIETRHEKTKARDQWVRAGRRNEDGVRGGEGGRKSLRCRVRLRYTMSGGVWKRFQRGERGGRNRRKRKNNKIKKKKKNKNKIEKNENKKKKKEI